jgi:glycosyltransferase involved in cell wall biosynthesis
MELPPLEEQYPHHQRSLEIPDYVVITETIKGKEENSKDKSLEKNKEKMIMSSGVISIIIPVYNTGQFLNRCVESVLQQSYRNIEVLLIDDGSTDNSGKLCDEWEKKDARIRTIHKENGGLSDARNAGLDAASGEFIAFVDSDDYIAPDMIQKLYDAIKKNNAEMSICRFLFVDEKGTPIRGKNKRIPEIEGTFSTHDVLKQAAEIGWYYTVAWNKLYKRSLFSEIRFPKGRLHEDLFVSHLLLELCGTVVCISEVGYYYVQHEGSILKNKSKKLYLDAAKAYLERSSFFCRHGLQKGAGKAYLLSALCLTDACLIKSDKPEIQEEWEALFKSFQKNYRFKNYCTKKEKLQISIICSNPELYYLLFRNSYERKAKAIIDLCAERISTR